jgi:hypothetical protein
MICSSQAFAYSITSGISYDMPNERLSGYSRTRKTSTDPFFYDVCIDYYYNDVTGWECSVILYHTYGVYADQYVWSPVGGYLSNYAMDQTDALTGFSNFLTTLSAGTWGEQGEHYVYADVYIQYCYYGCGFPEYYYTAWSYLDSHAQQAKVCTANASDIDTAGVAWLAAWPAEPWESAMSIYCTGDQPLPPPYGNLEYRNFYFSFGGILASNDPCATYASPGSADMAGDMHTHPWFSSSGWIEEMNAGLGCGSASGSPITFTDYIYVWAWLHGSGAEFSSGDRSVVIATGKPGYMKVPAGDVIKRLMPNMTESQVYP